LLVNSDILSKACKAVAHAAAQLRIVAKSDIVACFQFNAFVTTLFSTALVEVVERAESIQIWIAVSGILTQLAQSK
jgi:hypothetical protein